MNPKKTTVAEKWARVLLLAAAIGAGIIAWTYYLASPLAGCGAGEGCDTLLQGRWASVLEIPVSWIDLGVYLVALLASLLRTPFVLRAAVWGSIPVAAGWFLAVQLGEGAFCIWCCAIHLLASIGAILLLLHHWGRREGDRISHGIAGLTGGIAAIATLAALQLNQEEATAASPVESPIEREVVSLPVKESEIVTTESGKLIHLLDGEVSYDLSQLPVIGDSNAKNVLVALTDYTCTHCRRFTRVLETSQRALGEDYCIVLLPASRDIESEEIHRYMLALWMINQNAHARVDARIRSGAVRPRPRDVLEDIVRTVGGTEFSLHYGANRKWIAEQIETTRRLQDAHAEKMDRAVLPQVVIGKELLMGAHTDAAYYVSLARKYFEGGTDVPIPDEMKGEMGAPEVLLKSSVVDAGAVAPGARVPVTVEF